MSIAERRERQRAERYELIVAAACELAEAEGWDAVTTRRLAGLIDYSQPVLYSHFKGKADIMAAVATRGFEELAEKKWQRQTSLALRTFCATSAPPILILPAQGRSSTRPCSSCRPRSNSPARKRRQFSGLPSPRWSPHLDQILDQILVQIGKIRNLRPKCCGARCTEWSSSSNLNVSQLQAPRFD